ncbi:unnamed protein product, partial [Polarella glacialis]
AYYINLTVTSRWGLSTTLQVKLTKLGVSAPMVDISGPSTITVNRTQLVSLLANGVASECINVKRELGYRWSENTGQLDLSMTPDIVYTTRSLVIPAFVLEPVGSGNDVNVYNFTVMVVALDGDGNPISATVSASVTVKVQRSPVYVSLATEDRMMTRGDILVLDARESQDPDYPTNPGMTFRGSFRWWCLNPARLPCFGSDPLGEFPPLETCTTDINSRITSGGQTFSTPLFEDRIYCRWARGVLMVSTTNFTAGEYIFTVLAEAVDGRTSKQDVRITITEMQVPQIRLEINDPVPKFPVTTQ